MRQGDWKLIGNDNRNAVKLYNLADELPETKNYATEKPKIASRLVEMHNRWREEVMPE